MMLRVNTHLPSLFQRNLLPLVQLKFCENDLMLIRHMIGQDQNEIEPTQKENIFQIRWQINKWIFSLIIDGRSSSNVASIMLVEKLG